MAEELEQAETSPEPAAAPEPQQGAPTGIPAGYSVEPPIRPQSGQTAPTGIPAGYTVEPAHQPTFQELNRDAVAHSPQTPSTPSTSLKVANAIDSVTGIPAEMMSGAAKSLGKTILGGGKLLADAAQRTTDPLHVISPAGSKNDVDKLAEKKSIQNALETHGYAEGAGAIAEQIMEFAAGDEALKGVTSMAKMPKALLEILEKYPKAAKLIQSTLSASAVGGAQGATQAAGSGKDAAEGAKGGAEGGAVGGAIGGAVSQGVDAILPAARRLFGKEISAAALDKAPSASLHNPALKVTPRDVLEHAEKEGIDLTPAQATKASAARMLQSLGSRSVLAADKLNAGIDENAGKLQQSVRAFADKADPQVIGVSPESAGDAIKSVVESSKGQRRALAEQAYDKIKEVQGTAKVDVSDIQKEWQKNAQAMKVVLDNAPKDVAGKLSEVLEKGSSLGTPEKVTVRPAGASSTSTTGPSVSMSASGTAPKPITKTVISPNLSFQDAIKLRSFFHDMGETNQADLPKAYQAFYKKLSGDLDGAMETAADKAGFKEDWRAANKDWKDYVEKYGDKQSPLYRVLNQDDPARVTKDLLARKSAEDIRLMQGENMDKALEPLKRQVIMDIANKNFKVGIGGLGGYGDSFLKTLFGDEETKELYTKADIGRRFQWEQNPSGTSNVLMSEHQIDHPDKLIKLVGGAKTSMPKPAQSFMPKPAIAHPQTAAVIGATAKTLAAKAGAAAALEGKQENPPEE